MAKEAGVSEANEVLVQYRVRPDQVAEQEAAVKDWLAAVRALADPEIRYTVYRGDDGVTFVHHVRTGSEAGQERLTSLPEFKPFGEGTRARADGELSFTRMTLLESSA
jgi:hypothetical protein